ncbi:MAG TPA: sigma-70 family RNA polymerase sigma factor [Vicinamibacterales bacterium]|nr:sigma-70 family RNA polymerase sigma factor [Vicinamibacterales bacterium]
MPNTPLTQQQQEVVSAHLSLVESMARRMVATMPRSVELDDLKQDGVLGLMRAAQRFDRGRGVKFETFAEPRVRGAMIDGLRRNSWPRNVRSVRRKLEAARHSLRQQLNEEPTVEDLAGSIGADTSNLEQTMLRISKIELISPYTNLSSLDRPRVPPMLLPAAVPAPDEAYERVDMLRLVRRVLVRLSPRDQRIVSRYHFGHMTMKEIGREMGVNESRVSQLHTRAIYQLRKMLAVSTSERRQVAPVEAARARLRIWPASYERAQGGTRRPGASGSEQRQVA